MLKELSFLSLPILLAVAGCASAPPPNLVDARAAYQRASQGPAARLAPAQLHVAQTSLDAAERTYEAQGDSDDTRDRAYVAQRNAELAETQASIVASNRNSVLAARRIEAAKAHTHGETVDDLNATKAELAGEKSIVANQTVALAGEKQRRQEAERRAADAMAALTEIATVKQEPRGTVITLSGSVIFASGKAELLPGAQTKLDQVAIALAEGDPQAKIVVEGHTDSRGSNALNQDLSARRAAAVRSYLVSKGLAPERVVAQGVGPSRPIADNETAEGRANNRRVEVVIQPLK
jgi:outer membrane protein OmpA-like peptidoglycan-associated protein